MFSSLFVLCVSVVTAATGSPWQGVLDAHRTDDGRVRYAAIQAADATATTVTWLKAAEPAKERDAQLAFWINAYNALTIALVAKSWPLKSIRELDNGEVWKTRRFVAAGRSLTLDQIEHQIILPLGDPRAHFALNCAAISCPPLSAKAFVEATLEQDLEALTRSWVQGTGVRVDRATRVLHLSRLFDWYATDFSGSLDAPVPGVEPRLQGVIHFIQARMLEADAQWVRAGGYTVQFMPYDWGVNAATE